MNKSIIKYSANKSLFYKMYSSITNWSMICLGNEIYQKFVNIKFDFIFNIIIAFTVNRILLCICFSLIQF